MGKSRKKPDPDIDSDPAIASAATEGIKKQKIGNGDEEHSFQKKNLGKETEENTEKEQKNSLEENKKVKYEEEDGDEKFKEDGQQLETPTRNVELPPAIKSAVTIQYTRRERISNEHLEEEKDDNSKHLETSMESVELPPAIKSPVTIQYKRRERISYKHLEEEKDDNSKEDHKHLETPMESVKMPPTIKSEERTQDANKTSISNQHQEEDGDSNVDVALRDAKRARISNEYEEEVRDDTSNEDDQHLETLIANDSDAEMIDDSSLNKTPQIPGSRTVLMENLSFLITEKDVKDFFKNAGEISEIHFEMKDDYFTGHGHVEFTASEAAKEALKLNNTSLLDRPVKLHLASEKDEHPNTTHNVTGSKTVYLGNLSFAIYEDDVRDLFKDVGEIKEIRFGIRNDKFLGYGYVEFTTVEAAQEALKLDKTLILDRKVKLYLARERGSYTSGNSLEKSNQTGGHAQARSLYVRGFDRNRGFDDIRSTLEKHFSKCGEISRINIPKYHDSGNPKGVAFIDFADNDGFSKGLRLDGSEIGGNKIIVEEARGKRDDWREGSGYGGGRGGYGGQSSSSGGGYGRESGSCGGGGWGRASGGSGGGWSSSSGGGWRREGSGYGGDYRGVLGRGSGGSGSGWSGGGGFNNSRVVGRFSGGSRGGGGSRY